MLTRLNLSQTTGLFITGLCETYEGINRANNCIGEVGKWQNNLTDVEKKGVIAEAKFIEGSVHFLRSKWEKLLNRNENS
jgi:hypothetical protein